MIKRGFKRVFFVAVLLCLLLGPNVIAVLAQSQDEQPLTHVVEPGENLFRIALRYGVDMGELARANGITNQSRIYSGQVLVIPGLAVADGSAEVFNPLVAGTPITHTVQRGETLGNIAQRYNTTVQEILQANQIANPNRILPGQQLNIWAAEIDMPVEPVSAPPELVEGAPPESSITYVVQRGENLSQIALRHGVNWRLLAQVNGITNPDHVYSGQVLTIPGANARGTDMGIIAPAIDAPAATVTSGKQIIISLSRSRIYAYEDGHLVRNVLVSTGRAATPTVRGDFSVIRKVRAQRMVGPGYNLPNVEWVMYFYANYAIHGTYWHNNFGTPMSYGCVNLPNHEAEWFYNWAEHGTPVRVQL
jgi:LysM repeat protein